MGSHCQKCAENYEEDGYPRPEIWYYELNVVKIKGDHFPDGVRGTAAVGVQQPCLCLRKQTLHFSYYESCNKPTTGWFQAFSLVRKTVIFANTRSTEVSVEK